MSNQSALQRNAARIVGSGSRTLVLAHGFGTDQTAWQRVVPALAADNRLVLFDHMGAGSSDVSAYSPRRYQSMHGYATDMLELLAELEVTDAIYVGHSMSAMIGMLAAREEPSRFRTMIFMNASPRYLNDSGYHGGFEQEDIDALYEAMASNYHAWVSGVAPLAVGNPERADIAQEFARSLGQVRPDIGLAMVRMVYQSDHRTALGQLQIPTVLVQTRHDAFVPAETGDYLARNIPNATLIVLETRGHVPHMTAPELVIAAIRSVLDTSDSRS